ncbi:MAG: hypothetical protein IJN54_15045 [Lachnospiraceae bacterium]|nr:hypothetical protein [Lachnospiraceae bacterium]
MEFFMDTWNTILQFYENYIGDGYSFYVYVASLVFLIFTEKKKQIKTILIIAPVIMLACFSFPPFKMLFDVIGLDSETYYRILWLIPMGITIAYAGVKLFEKYIWVGLAVMCALVIYTGNYVYDNPNITKAENGHHIPQIVINLCDAVLMDADEDESRVWVVFPSEFIHYVRQYTDVICMPYGREALVDRWGFEYHLKDLMEAEEIQSDELAEEVRNCWCEYVILSEHKNFSEPLENYGFELINTVNEYNIYRDTEIE